MSASSSGVNDLDASTLESLDIFFLAELKRRRLSSRELHRWWADLLEQDRPVQMQVSTWEHAVGKDKWIEDLDSEPRERARSLGSRWLDSAERRRLVERSHANDREDPEWDLTPEGAQRERNLNSFWGPLPGTWKVLGAVGTLVAISAGLGLPPQEGIPIPVWVAMGAATVVIPYWPVYTAWRYSRHLERLQGALVRAGPEGGS